MISKEIYLKNISRSLALLSKEVELLNCINLYDINISSEDFFTELLNLIFDYKLKNVNTKEKNAVAIDLVDDENKISVQVTSDNTSTKIKHTINEYIYNNKYLSYNRLIVLIITKKKSYTAKFDTKNKFDFNTKTDILDVEDLIKYIKELSTDKIKTIDTFLNNELYDKVSTSKKTQSNEIDTIIDLIEYISNHKKVKKKLEVAIDPEYKIYKRFKNFSERLITEYTNLLKIYGNAIELVEQNLGIDEAKDIVIMLFLQDISMNILEETNDNPVKALNRLVDYFEDKLSVNGKKYDKVAIKFYLTSEMIKCNVFPNERNEYNGNK
ncbi:SMEK domain-containing protein [Herbivorax sp. ANBcel31]|uniref:SMEK domain-containing protein n=1 Tax=Herbivorax sp. ANBcel31 TaxID=3069754 RepID=UPI0027AF2F55|nr:SMEK domain-containing protein [Herbivorax sp. ANBcel31]MDQ2088051.1 SMEK domain-containing protein [Herbivorax sp. ANBcel31]